MMSVVRIALMFVSLAAASGVALGEPAVGRWSVTPAAAGGFEAELSSDERLSDGQGGTAPALLIVSCSPGGLAATLSWPDFIPHELGKYTVSVGARPDGGSAQSSEWAAADTAVTRRGSEALDWLAAAAKAQRLIVRVPDRPGGQQATFSVDGLAALVDRLQQASCR